MILLFLMLLVLITGYFVAAEIAFERDWPRSTIKGFIISLVLLLMGLQAFGQASRTPPSQVTTINQSAPQPGGMYPMLAIPGSAVAICNAPANAVPCTNFATTYTSASAGVACPSNAQLTRDNSTTCVANSDETGAWAAWLNPGNYQFTVTASYGSFGPYDFSIGGGGGGGAGNPAGPAFAVNFANGTVTQFQGDPTFTINPTTHQVIAEVVNGSINESLFAGANLTARVQAACSSSVAVPGQTVRVNIPATETDTTPMTATLSSACVVEDDRGICFAGIAGNISCNAVPQAPGGISYYSQSVAASHVLATNPYQIQSAYYPVAGGINSLRAINGDVVLQDVTISGTGTGYTSGPAIISGGTPTYAPAQAFCSATAGAVTSIFIAASGEYSSVSGLSVNCPGGTGQTFTPVTGIGTKSNYLNFNVVQTSRTPGQHFPLQIESNSYSNGDAGMFDLILNCFGHSTAAGDQLCNLDAAKSAAGFPPLGDTSGGQVGATVAAINGNILTLCGSTALTGSLCSVAPTRGNQIAEQLYLVNTTRAPYMTGTAEVNAFVSGTNQQITGSGTSWAGLSSSNPAANFPNNLFFEFTQEPIQAGIASMTYVSGGTFSGTGNCPITGLNGGGSAAQLQLAVSSGVPGAITINNRGNTFVTAPTTGTVSNPNSASLTCSGTITVTSTLQTPTNVHQVMQVQSISSNTLLSLYNTSSSVDQPYLGNIGNTFAPFSIYQGSIVTGVSSSPTSFVPVPPGYTFTTVYAKVGDPSQFQVGDKVMEPGGSMEEIRSEQQTITQNVPMPGASASAGYYINNGGRFPIYSYSFSEGGIIEAAHISDWTANAAGTVPLWGDYLEGPTPGQGFFFGLDKSLNNLERMLGTNDSSNLANFITFDRTNGNNFWNIGGNAYFSESGATGLGQPPISGQQLAVNGNASVSQNLTVSGLLSSANLYSGPYANQEVDSNFQTGAWTKGGPGVGSFTANQGKDIYGNTTAGQLTHTSGSGVYVTSTPGITMTSGNTYAFAVWLQAVTVPVNMSFQASASDASCEAGGGPGMPGSFTVNATPTPVQKVFFCTASTTSAMNFEIAINTASIGSAYVSIFQIAGAPYCTICTDTGPAVITSGSAISGNGFLSSGNPFSAGGGGVTSIDTLAGAFTFTGAGVSHVGNAYTFSGTGSGVSSVAMTVPSWLTVAGSPITSSGTLAVSGTTETQNLVLASPSGSSGAVSPRALVVSDLPTGIANANLANPSTTVNGQTCTLGSSCTVAGAVTSVSNGDGSLNVTPTTGIVVASINTAHANTWTGKQTFTGTGIPIATGTTSNTDLAGFITLSGGTGTYTFTATYASAPVCVATDTTAVAAVQATSTTTVLTINGTGTDIVAYHCIGRT